MSHSESDSDSTRFLEINVRFSNGAFPGIRRALPSMLLDRIVRRDQDRMKQSVVPRGVVDVLGQIRHIL